MEKDSPEFWMALPDPRKPDHRWRQAGWSVLTNQPPSRDEDVWVRRTYRYQLERLEPPRDVGGDLPDWKQQPPRDVDNGGDRSRWDPADPYADIAAAHAIHVRSDEDGIKGFLIGAILSDAAPEAIAEVAHLPLPVVQAFEALFVDVRSKLKAGGCIAVHFFRGPDGRDRGHVGLCSQIGCHDGFEHLSKFYKTGDMTPHSSDRLAVVSLQRRIIETTALMRMMEITSQNAPKIIRMATPLMAAAAARGMAADQGDRLREAMDECLADGPGAGHRPVNGGPPPFAGDFAVDDDDDA